MQALIPAAGYGTRLRPLTFSTPKVLLPVAGKPIIVHIIDDLIQLGIDDFTLIIGYLEDQVEEYILERYKNENVNFNFIVQNELLGLGHAIKMGFAKVDLDAPLLILLGDTIIDCDWGEVLDSDISKIGIYEVEDPRRFGVVETDGQRVTHLEEKPEHPKSNKILAGTYYLHRPRLLDEALDEIIEKGITTKNEYQVTDALQLMLDRGLGLGTFDLTEWLDCGKPETLLATNRTLLAKYNYSCEAKFEESNTIRPPVHIPSSVKLTNCIIGPNVSLGKNCIIEDTFIEESIGGSGMYISDSRLSQSLLGNNINIRCMNSTARLGDDTAIYEL